MAVTLDATIAGASANSYVTQAQADTYFVEHPHYDTAWAALSSASKDQALVYATKILDYWVDWNGNKASDTQALRWPRNFVKDLDGYAYDSDEIPKWLREATSELAYILQASNTAAEPDTKGYKEMEVGSLRLVIDKEDRDGATLIPDVVKAMIEPFGSVRTRNGPGSVKLLRS